ncbi:MAG: hypothetical protein ACK4E0_14505 [Chitinophagaceae bacterium]
MTDDLLRRIQQHQLGYNRTTAPYAPFQLIYQEEFPNFQSSIFGFESPSLSALPPLP